MINANGSYTGDRGYSRGFVGRTDPGFDGFSNMWLLPESGAVNPDLTSRVRVNGSDLLCHPSQRTSNYTNPAYPKLQATAGSYIAMKYLENGHVTLPWTLTGKPANGGTVLIFGTNQPNDQEKITDVMQWTADGSGGDKRGFLMGQMDYDDGQCHQLNTCWVSAERQILFPNDIPGQGDTQAERFCESDIKIPENVATGTLSVYWVWDWGTTAGESCDFANGKDEYYTNCADIEIVAAVGDSAGSNAKLGGTSPTSTVIPLDPNTQAVKNFASRTAVNSNWKMTTAANWADYNNKAAASPLAASLSTVCSAKAAAALADPNAPAPSCPPGSYAPTGAEYTSWAASIKANGAIKTTDAAAPATSAPATTAPPASAAPAISSAPAAPANSSAPASAAPAPPQPSSGGAMGSVVTVTETQVSVSTLTTYMATPSASSPPAASSPAAASSQPAAPAPSAPAAAPPAEASPSAEGNAGGYPTISIISDTSAGMTASAGPAAPSPEGGAPYNATAGRNGMGGERSPPRRHARDLGRTP